MLPVSENSDVVVNLDPFALLRRRGHGELGASRVACLRYFVGGGDLLDIHRVGKTWRAQPIARRAERLFGSASFAVSRVLQVSGADIEGPGKAALATFKVKSLRFPRVITLVTHGGIDSSRRIAFAGNPYLFARRILAESDRKALGWCEAHD